jgi:glyoxylase-like metal-dependent hydrolase (beta-lactamase superfamily II)
MARGLEIGDVAITRIVEQQGPFFGVFDFFPDLTAERLEENRAWLEPVFVDPASQKVNLCIQSYVVRTPHHTILIDSCVGNHKPRPSRPMWHMMNSQRYESSFKEAGLTFADIDYVMCTHLHTDHVGWNTRLEGGRWVPTFPNARYVFSKKELEAWEKGNPKFTRHSLEDSVLPVIAAGQAQLVTNDFALDDEVWLEPSPGHTPDHVSVRLASNGHSAVMSGDLMHSPVQCLHPEWTAWPDWDADQAKRTRRTFMERYADTDTLVCTAHFPLPSAGRVVAAGDAFRFEPEADW